MTVPELEASGCPYRKDVLGLLLCTCSGCYLEEVTDYIMCEVDWESCPDYQKQQSAKAEK